ncbi:MAG: ABC transporter substrate-binding protein [Jatrophihabitans sp.]
MRNQSKLTIGVTVLTAMALLAACSSSGGGAKTSSSRITSAAGGTTGSKPAYNAAFDKVVNPSTKTGGTLKLLASVDCDSWDPARTYYGWCWNMQRLCTRSLMGYQVVNGTDFKPVPDLATAAGKHNADFTEWTYTLKDGLKWSNGSPITPADVKYGLERLYSPAISGGPVTYFQQSIAHPKDYAGPYTSGDLNSITTTDKSITIKLTSPNADFDNLMAMPASAPVPNGVEGGTGFKGATYTKHPVSSGPYMIQSYSPAKKIVFVKNPNWSQSTDTIRHPLVDEVDMTVDTSLTDIDNQLQSGQADAAADAKGVQAAFQTKILTQPSLKTNADDPVTAFTRFVAVMPSVVTNLHCRLAIFYAFDKAAYIRAYGGPTAGEAAGSMTPPGIDGYDASYNPYPSGSDNTGDVAKAKDELKLCGRPTGFTLKFAYATPSDQATKMFSSEQQALGRVGIHVTPITQDGSSYYSTFIGSPQNIKNQKIGMANAGWGADFPTGVGFYQSIANGNAILPTGNSNYPSLNDPTVNKILDAAPAGKATGDDWKNLDKAVMASGVYLPILYGKTLYYRNPRMTNVTCDNALAFGMYDFVNVGVSG